MASNATAADPKKLPRNNEGDWTVPKLIGLLLFVLSAFFCFIYYVSP